MTFATPLWLLAGVAACLGLLWAWRRYDTWRQLTLAQFVSPHLGKQLTRSVSPARRRAKRALLMGAIALLFVALAGPQAGYHWEQVTRRGNDIIFAIDTSRSMLTPDVKPNRLARAKLAVSDFVAQLDGDAVGLIAFAGDAFLQSPLTLDYSAFQDSLNALDTHIIPRGGTDITSAIREAQAALHARPGADKILVLVTDGEDLEGNAVAAAKAAFEQDGLKIYTVGVGTSNGELIPLPADQGGGFLKDAAGNPVKSRLDETNLRAIAAASGGIYAPMGPEGQGLESIYRQALAPLAKHDLAAREQKIFIQRYQWPLGAALGMLLGSLLISNRRRFRGAPKEAANAPSNSHPAIGTALSVLGLLLMLPGAPARASAASAAKAYAKGDFAAAERDYAAAAQRNPKVPALQYNVGTAAYKAGQFAQATAAFQASLGAAPSADDKRLAEQENAYYDLGNALYRTGQKSEQSDPQTTIQDWTQAIKAYQVALQLRGGDADSKFNRDFVIRKLEALKKQPPPKSAQSPSGGSSQPKEQSKPSAGKPSPDQQGQQQKTAQRPSNQGAQGNRAQPKPQPGSGTSQPNQTQQASQPGQPPTPAAGNPQPGNSLAGGSGERKDGGGQAQEDQSLPGQMSREEARELLNSVKDDERRYPSAPLARNAANNTASEQPGKDW